MATCKPFHFIIDMAVVCRLSSARLSSPCTPRRSFFFFLTERQPSRARSVVVPRLPASAMPGLATRPSRPGCGGVQIRELSLVWQTALGNSLATHCGTQQAGPAGIHPTGVASPSVEPAARCPVVLQTFVECECALPRARQAHSATQLGVDCQLTRFSAIAMLGER